MFADSHIHLSHRSYDGQVPCIQSVSEPERIAYLNEKDLLEKMQSHGIAFVVEPAIDVDSNYKIIKLCEKYPKYVYPAIGLHPTRTYGVPWKRRKELEELSKAEKIVAIGELGLDYHHERRSQHRLCQKRWFLWQLLLADRRKLPLILHLRMADKDGIRLLRLFKKKIHGGVWHCFQGGPELAKIATGELGLHLGIGGTVLQNGSEALVETVRNTPLEYLILETDGPYVKPEKPEDISGKQWQKARNTSLIIPDIAQRVAQIKGISVDEVERQSTENVCRLFGIHS